MYICRDVETVPKLIEIKEFSSISINFLHMTIICSFKIFKLQLGKKKLLDVNVIYIWHFFMNILNLKYFLLYYDVYQLLRACKYSMARRTFFFVSCNQLSSTWSWNSMFYYVRVEKANEIMFDNSIYVISYFMKRITNL